MFTRKQASIIRQEFWTAFGKYMRPIPSAEGTKVNWVNYHTGIKNIHFRMAADHYSAAIYISIEHPDPEVQELYFVQFLELKEVLHVAMREEWQWQLLAPLEDGKIITRIYKEMSGVSVFNRDDWPELISFFKQRIIALDSFWENAKYRFESLH